MQITAVSRSYKCPCCDEIIHVQLKLTKSRPVGINQATDTSDLHTSFPTIFIVPELTPEKTLEFKSAFPSTKPLTDPNDKREG